MIGISNIEKWIVSSLENIYMHYSKYEDVRVVCDGDTNVVYDNKSNTKRVKYSVGVTYKEITLYDIIINVSIGAINSNVSITYICIDNYGTSYSKANTEKEDDKVVKNSDINEDAFNLEGTLINKINEFLADYIMENNHEK